MNTSLTTFSGLILQAQEMNTDIQTAFSLLCSDEQTKRYRNLLQQTKPVNFFEHEGTIYKGNQRIAAINFMLDNPTPADFKVWLDNNYQTYSPNK